MYSANGVEHQKCEQKLDEACIEYAKWLGLSLVSCARDSYDEEYISSDVSNQYEMSISQNIKLYNKTLVSKAGMAPYEYVDMGDGMTQGKYKIKDEGYGGLIYLYERGD